MTTLTKDIVVPSDIRFLSRDPATPELLDILNIEHQWAQHIRIIDRRDGLVLLHYINTWVSSEDHTVNTAPLKEIGIVRGIVIDESAGKIICRSLPYTPEVRSDELDDALPEDLSGWRFYNACEGTILRLFWALGEWHLSTHRKINAKNSYWSGPTFGSIFEEFNFDLEQLSKELCYVFLVSHNDNRLIYEIPEPRLMHITTFNATNGVYVEAELQGCVKPEEITGITTKKELQTVADEMEAMRRFDRSGVIGFADPTNPCPVRVVNPRYDALRNARGNEPNLRARYVYLRGTPEGELLTHWYENKDYKEVFANVELEVDDLVERLHSMYVNRYINKDFSQLPKEEFVTLQRCHKWHTDDYAHNRVTIDRVREFLSDTPPRYLLVMLNRQRRERRVRQKIESAEDCTTNDQECGESTPTDPAVPTPAPVEPEQ
jgi:hypothetical protein